MLGSGEAEFRFSPMGIRGMQLGQGAQNREVGTAGERNPLCPQPMEDCNKLKACDSKEIKGEFAGCAVTLGSGCSYHFYGWISVKC